VRGVVVLLVFAACGRFHFGPVESDATAPGDVAVAPRCDLAKPYGPPVALVGLSSPSAEIGVEATDDMLDGVMWSDRSGIDRIYEVTRATPADAFAMPQLVANLGSIAGVPDRDPAVTGDGLTLVFTSQRAGGGNWDLYATTRPSRSQPFAAPAQISELATAGADWGPFIASDGLSLYYVIGGDLAYSHRATPASPWSAPGTVLTELDTPSNEFEPAVTADELTIFYASDRPDGGLGGLDIWTATRASTADPFNAPSNLVELDTPGDDIPSWISPDRCELFLTRTNGAAGWDLYVSTKPL
jgi:hypothetical protein